MTSTRAVTSRRAIVRILSCSGFALASAMAPTEAVGQDESRRRLEAAAAQDSFSYRVATFSPRSGPPGTEVVVRWQYLPALTPVRLGVGAQRVGFQVLKEVLTDATGEVNDTLVIPYWAEPEQPHLLVVHDFYFHTLAVSSEFTVTSPDGVFRREGRIAEGTSGCRVLEGDGGQLYHLAGDVGPLEIGARAMVEGRVADPALCGVEGQLTMRVTRVRRPD